MRITGVYLTREVCIDGKRLTPDLSLKLRDHSPTGFAWGYGGSGPAQLALAILLAAPITPKVAEEMYQEFKRDVIQKLPMDDFAIDIDVKKWLRKQLVRGR